MCQILQYEINDAIHSNSYEKINYVSSDTRLLFLSCYHIVVNVRTIWFACLNKSLSKVFIWLKKHVLTVTLRRSSEPSFTKYASVPSIPSTWQKQLVVCPIPDGRIFSRNIALMTELLPFDVRPKKATFMWSRLRT